MDYLCDAAIRIGIAYLLHLKASMPNDKPAIARPTSPHLGIYRPQISTVLSITHRMTGLALVAGMVLIVAWLCTAAYNPNFFATLHDFLSSQLGLIILLCWTAAFYFHFANGIRHLFWDIGKGFTLPQMHRSGWLVILFTLFMTAITWGFVYGVTAAMGQ